MNIEEYLQELDELISAAPEVIDVEILRVYRVETSTDRTHLCYLCHPCAISLGGQI